MRVVFMGTPVFAATVLEELARHHEVVGVYTRPDAVRGRGKKLLASPVKELAQSLELPVFEPRSLRTPEAQQELRDLDPDVICVAAYGAILPREVLDIPPYGCLNVHGSLLPRWRGAAPIERAILAGDEEAGVCIMRMEEGLDTGDYCISRSIPIEDKNADELIDELSNLGARALITAIAHLEEDGVRWTAQDESGVTYAEKLGKGELDLDPGDSADVNARRVQASSATHPARCVVADRGVTITRARVASRQEAPASLGCGDATFIAKRLYLGCVSGMIEVLAVKPDGKKEMDARSFAAGCPVLRSEGAKWGRKNG